MFIDEMKIYARAGKGGDGVVRWRHIKGKALGGPSGGNGGKGGAVCARAVRDLGILARYRNKKEFEAENGGDGMADSMHGKDGEDLVIDVPIGSIVVNKNTEIRYELLENGEKVKLLSGGRGGLGNEHFKGSKNTTPKESTKGVVGEDGDFFIEVELVVDAGFAGFPNAGKSSLLNALTRAQAKIGSYPFTTVEPGLGELYGYILADIPGLILGAAEGKGLGHKFLRHIKRTKTILHCVSFENEDMEAAYKTIRGELEKYDSSLAQKPELLILTKSDLADTKTVAAAVGKMKEYNKNVIAVSVYDDASVKKLSDTLLAMLRSNST
ncbi:MAG: GTPase ObgE [Patescibacteria group bacterium]